MPKATANTTDVEQKDLKSLAGAYVVLRRMTYGEKLTRRAMVSGMKVLAEKGKSDFEGEMQLINEKATMMDFSTCVVDHNLFKDDDETDKINLANPLDVKMLDPRVGEEIDTLINEMNNFEEDEGN